MRAVNLLVPCLVDQFFPRTAVAGVAVLERLGLEVRYPEHQTCCGQPAFNAGCPADARALARRVVAMFRPEVPAVVLSGSCTTMIRRFYPELFDPGDPGRAAVEALLPQVYEFSEFLVERLGVTDVGARFPGRVAYHDGCHQLRELGIHSAPRRLLRAVRDLELVELDDDHGCCGFGGLFSVKFPHVSEAIVAAKIEALCRAGVHALVSGDTGCLMQIGGAVARRGLPIRTLHLAEVLAAR